MKHYVLIIRLREGEGKERAIIVKAKGPYEATRLADKWRGTVMNVAELITNEAYIRSLKGHNE